MPRTDTSGCAAICIVKDEAPYIHEYIHHHLSFGFKQVIILVNRTSDNTIAILHGIGKTDSRVYHETIDWIDILGLGHNIQNFGFAYGISLLIKHGKSRYALLSDADEFWYPTDFTSHVDSWLAKLGDFQQVSLCWARQLSRETPYEPPFSNPRISISSQVKSIVDIYSPIKGIHMHMCRGGPRFRHVDARGKLFDACKINPKRYGGDPLGHSAYILHRMQRSEPEYIALLARGRPYSQESSALKLNRTGYNDEYDHLISIPCNDLESYLQSLRRFTKRCGIGDLVDQAKNKRLAIAANFGEIVSRNSEFLRMPSNKKKLMNCLKGTCYAGKIDQLLTCLPEDAT